MRFETVGGGCLSGLKRLRDDLPAEHTTYAIGLHATGEGIVALARYGEQADKARHKFLGCLFSSHDCGMAEGLR